MTDKFNVRKDLPIPPKQRSRKPTKYPFANMQSGDAFSVRGRKAFSNAVQSARMYSKRNGVLFVSRTGWVDGQPNQDGGTIWMVEDNKE